MKNLQEMTVQELIDTIKTDFHSDGSYEYVLSFSQSGVGFMRHYKGSSRNDTRKVWRRFNNSSWEGKYVYLTLQDIEREFKRAQIKQQIENLKIELRRI